MINLVDDDVVSEAVHLAEEEVHISFSDSRWGDNVPEEIWSTVIWLVADHDSAGLHHTTLQLGAYLRFIYTDYYIHLIYKLMYL